MKPTSPSASGNKRYARLVAGILLALALLAGMSQATPSAEAAKWSTNSVPHCAPNCSNR
jgi:hypothetical protein